MVKSAKTNQNDLILEVVMSKKDRFTLSSLSNEIEKTYKIKSKIKIKKTLEVLVDKKILETNGVSYWKSTQKGNKKKHKPILG